MSLEYYTSFEQYFIDDQIKNFNMMQDFFPKFAPVSISPRAQSQTAYESDEAELLSFGQDDSECSSSKNSQTSSVSFTDCKFDEIIQVVNSESTDLNSFVEEMLTAEPSDPTIKRK